MKTFGLQHPGLTYVDRPGAYGFLRNVEGLLGLVRTTTGLFLPGGGVEPGEAVEAALSREFFEEIGYRVECAHILGQAAQYHCSKFYGQNFHKVGTFYSVEAEPIEGAVPADEHTLEWWTIEAAGQALTQEYQRWATAEWS